MNTGPVFHTEWPETLSHRIETMVQAHGQDTVVKYAKDISITYNQMAQRGETIAAALLAANCDKASRVAVFQEPTPDWICSLAILKIGAVLRVALSGAEQVTENLMKGFRTLGKIDLRLFNGYGPTETTCCSSKMELFHTDSEHTEERIPAGYTSPNESIYIVDENLQLVPIGFPGEIVVGGVGVAIGYLDNEELNKSTFVPEFYATDEYKHNGWTTMYRTGDRGRWLNDGSIIIEGRIADDTQIKLRGLRIDVGDVEQIMLKTANDSLAEVVVSVRTSNTNGSQFLVAHVVFLPAFPTAERGSFLQQLPSRLQLLQYMCPAIVIALDRLPPMVSAKLDRRTVSALPIPQSLLENIDSNDLSTHGTTSEEYLGRRYIKGRCQPLPD